MSCVFIHLRAVGFGFLTFENEDSVEQACAEHFVDVNGKQVNFLHLRLPPSSCQFLLKRKIRNIPTRNIPQREY